MRKKVGGKIGGWGNRWFEKVSECHQVQIILLLALIHFTFVQVKIRQSSLHGNGLFFFLLTHLICFDDRNYLNQGTKRSRKQGDKMQKNKDETEGRTMCLYRILFFYIYTIRVHSHLKTLTHFSPQALNFYLSASLINVRSCLFSLPLSSQMVWIKPT